jgi:hypothetical protein
MRVRKEQAEHFYTPLGMSFRIIGASHSEAFGKCFVVEGIPHERTFRADQFEFETVIERDNLWELLRAKELKRVKNKRVKENARARKERDRVRNQQDDYAAQMDETIEKATRWTYEPTQPLREISDEELAETESIGRADSEGHASYDEQLEVALSMEASAEIESEEDY